MKLATMEEQEDVCLTVVDLRFILRAQEETHQLLLFVLAIQGTLDLHVFQLYVETGQLLGQKYVMMEVMEDAYQIVQELKQTIHVLLEAQSHHPFVLVNQDINFLQSIVLQFVEMDMQLDQKFVMMEIWEDVYQIVLVHSKNSFATGEVKWVLQFAFVFTITLLLIVQ